MVCVDFEWNGTEKKHLQQRIQNLLSGKEQNQKNIIQKINQKHDYDTTEINVKQYKDLTHSPKLYILVQYIEFI